MTDCFKINSEKTAAVSLVHAWIPVGVDTPRGVNMWLINRPSGVSLKGIYNPNDSFPTHWFPNPTFTDAP